MSEREAVSVVPALSPFKGPGIKQGAPSDKIFLVTYSDGSLAYRCVTCAKEFPTFNGAWGHITHHGRTKESYLHDGRSLPRKRKPKDPLIAMQQIIKKELDTYIIDLSNDLAAALIGTSESASLKAQQEIDDLRIKLAEEHALRVKAEKDLAKIKNLFK